MSGSTTGVDSQVRALPRLRLGRAGNVSLIVIGQSTQALGFGAIALFLPLIRSDLGISFTAAGALAAVSTLFYALMMVPAGFLADRYNPKTIFVIGLLGVNATTFVFAVTGSFELLIANQALSGIFRAMLFGPGMVLITSQFTPQRRATAMGLLVAGGTSSNVLLNLVGPFVVGSLGWRTLLVVLSTSAFAVAITYAAWGTPVTRQATVAPQRLGALPALLSHPVVWLTGVVQFVRLSVAMGLTFWLPSLLVEDKGFSLALAGLLLAASTAIVAPSNILGGMLSDRLQRPLLLIGVSVATLAISTALLVHAQGVVTVIAVLIVNAIFVQFYFGALFAVPLALLGTRNAGLLASVGNLFANLGALVTSVGLGIVKDETGSFNLGLYILAAMCLVAILATFAISRLKAPVAVPDLPTQQNGDAPPSP